jgi:cellulose synthase/poly-beta-1,6-N-acetylglucosamine synthase-like glycosyltransferase
MTALEIAFWLSAGLIVYTHVGYPLVLWALSKLKRTYVQIQPTADSRQSTVSVIVAAHNEEAVIERRVQNLLQLDYPRDKLEVIVASDGSSDATAERAREAGADLVLDLPRGGKIRAQDAGVDSASGEIVAFSDANAVWEPDALAGLVAPFADPKVGYVCGQVRFVDPVDGGNQEGAYWQYEMVIRALESRLAGVTAGNGAIYATRRDAYIVVDPRMGHDLSFPFNMVKRGWRALYQPAARAEEKMVPTVEGEFRRKRRMMSHTWPIVVSGGMLSPRGYGGLYALEIVSHRLLRYLTPFLHLIALGTNIALLGRGWVYTVTLIAQVALLIAGLLGVKIARYYVLVTASPAAGLFDWLRHGTPAEWEKAEGTR